MKIWISKVNKTESQSWERVRTEDGRIFDLLGDDLNTNTRAGRAAGAGAVWSWRPARASRAWSNDMKSFGSRRVCLMDLKRHLGVSSPPPLPVRCQMCRSDDDVVNFLGMRMCRACRASARGWR